MSNLHCSPGRGGGSAVISLRKSWLVYSYTKSDRNDSYSVAAQPVITVGMMSAGVEVDHDAEDATDSDASILSQGNLHLAAHAVILDDTQPNRSLRRGRGDDWEQRGGGGGGLLTRLRLREGGGGGGGGRF